MTAAHISQMRKNPGVEIFASMSRCPLTSEWLAQTDSSEMDGGSGFSGGWVGAAGAASRGEGSGEAFNLWSAELLSASGLEGPRVSASSERQRPSGRWPWQRLARRYKGMRGSAGQHLSGNIRHRIMESSKTDVRRGV